MREIGPGRVLLWVYGLFVVAAGARSAVQLSTHAGRAPLAYALSAVAAVVYAVGLVLLAGGRRRAATVWCGLELLGVVTVGVASTAAPRSFPDATVWSHFGSGYGFVPLVLPILALWWLRRPVTAPS